MRTRLLALLTAVGMLVALAPAPALAGSANDFPPGVALSGSRGSVNGSLSPKSNRDDWYAVPLGAGDELTLSFTGDAGTNFSMALFSSNIGNYDEWDSLFWFWQLGYPKETSYVVPDSAVATYSVDLHTMDASGSAGNYSLTWSKRHQKAARMYGLNRYDTAIAVSRSTFVTATTAIIASGENYPDALTASALAGVLHAPVLLTRKDELSDATWRELQRLQVTDVKIIGSNKVVSDGIMNSLFDNYDVERIGGGDRYETAQKVAVRVKQLGGSSDVFLVSGTNYADALSVSPIAYARKMPVLLTPPTSLAGQTQTALSKLHTTHVVIAGSTAAVYAGVQKSANAAVASNDTGGGHAVDRWQGSNRFLTGIDVANHATALGWASWGQVGISTAWNFPDALGGGAALGERGGLLLLTDTKALTPVVASALTKHDAEVRRAYILGSPNALSDTVRSGVLTALP